MKYIQNNYLKLSLQIALTGESVLNLWRLKKLLLIHYLVLKVSLKSK